MDGRALKHPAVRLALGALFIFALLAVWLMKAPAHDANWWKHVGLKPHTGHGNAVNVYDEDGMAYHVREDKPEPVVHRVDADTQKEPVVLKEGLHYTADYDVGAVRVLPEPTLTPGRQRLFSYVDPVRSPFRVRYVSMQPRIFVVPDFLSAAECDALVQLAIPRLRRSRVVPIKGADQGKTIDDVRTSTQTWLELNDPAVAPVVDRVRTLLGWEHDTIESMQILRYELNQKYNAHLDAFDPKLYGTQTSNRAATVFLYLNDCEEGGETWFPMADGKPSPTGANAFTSFTGGLKVKPTKGMIAVFYDMYPDGRLDNAALHGGAPVIRGTKFGGTLWLRKPVS